MTVQFVLMDIEGTTTDIAFVHKVLFPYSAERMEAFVLKNVEEPEVRRQLDDVKLTVQTEDNRAIDDGEAVQTLLRWVAEDRKHGALKALQGMIWKEGFETKAYQGHVYQDVPPALAAWKSQGTRLGIYSSGSVQAQQLLFGHSVAGDLTPNFEAYFDTAMGAKRETAAYTEIARQLQLPPQAVLFLSDVEAELEAASAAGMHVMQLVRDEQTTASTKFPHVSSFTEIKLDALQPV